MRLTLSGGRTVVILGCLLAVTAAAGPASRDEALAAYGRLPIAFVPNAGQLDGRVRYSAQAGGGSFFFTRREAVFSFAGKKKGLALRLRFPGANSRVGVVGRKRASGRVNYLIGRDPARWHRNLPTYGEVVYRRLWPGIDLVFRGANGRLKYELHVAPGASVRRIRLAYAGANRLSLDRRGNLRLETSLGTIVDSRPVGYQGRTTVASRFLLGPRPGTFGFAVGQYDRSRPLVIDPGLVYSTYLGGALNDSGYGIALDAERNAYVTGLTTSLNFPFVPGSYDQFANGGVDVFVSKLNAAGDDLVYSTYLGGVMNDSAFGIAVDAAGSAYVTGNTISTNFPTTAGAWDTSQNGSSDAFVTKLNVLGSDLAYSTYLGGSAADTDPAIALDASGSAYVAGRTASANFPTTAGAFDTSLGGSSDGYVTKLNPAGSALDYSKYLGGSAPASANDAGNGIVVDSTGSAHVTGNTFSTNFPTTAGAYDTSLGGASDAFVMRLNAAGTALEHSTYLGGTAPANASDSGTGIGIDGAGSVYVGGQTSSTDFPTTAGAYDTSFNGGFDAFMTKLSAAGSALGYSTYLGGSLNDGGYGAATGPFGGFYATGYTFSADFPVTENAFDTTLDGLSDVFVTRLNSTGSALDYSSYLGGNSTDYPYGGIAVDPADFAYVAGETASTNFPTTPEAFDTFPDGGAEAFVTKLNTRTRPRYARPPPPPRPAG